MAELTPDLPGIMVLSSEYPPTLESRNAVLQTACELVDAGYAAHIIDLAARPIPGEQELDYEQYTTGLNLQGIVIANTHKPSGEDALPPLLVRVAGTPGVVGEKVPIFFAGERPAAVGRTDADTRKLARKLIDNAIPLQGNYAQIANHIEGEQ
jgi:hypothetical protein